MTPEEYCTKEAETFGTEDKPARAARTMEAWKFATSNQKRSPGMTDLFHLGKLVEPSKNLEGFRKKDLAGHPPPTAVQGLMFDLFMGVDQTSPAYFYKRIMECCPLAEGNGRVGKIIFNWISGSLAEPVFPENDVDGAL